MSACSLWSLNLQRCVADAAMGWLWNVPVLVWIGLAIALVGAVWKLAGWPGIVALAMAIGYALGRRDAVPAAHQHGDDGPDALPPPRLPGAKRHVRTIFDIFAGR